jgi:hypothetical protein
MLKLKANKERNKQKVITACMPVGGHLGFGSHLGILIIYLIQYL